MGVALNTAIVYRTIDLLYPFFPVFARWETGFNGLCVRVDFFRAVLRTKLDAAVIPSSIDSVPVTAIGTDAFY